MLDGMLYIWLSPFYLKYSLFHLKIDFYLTCLSMLAMGYLSDLLLLLSISLFKYVCICLYLDDLIVGAYILMIVTSFEGIDPFTII